MAVAYRSRGTFTSRASAGTGNISVPAPSGHQAGDIFLLFATIVNTPAPLGATIDTPSGYTLIATSAQWGSGYVAISAVFWKIAASSSEANVAVGSTGNAVFLDVVIAAFSGGDTTTPIDAASTFGPNDTGTTRTQPAVTTITANALLAYFQTRQALTGLSAPGSATIRFDTGSYAAGHQVATRTTTSPGLVSSTTWSASPDSFGSVGLTIALRESGASAGSTYTKAGYATVGGVGSGPSESLFVEAGRALVGTVASGVSQKTGPVVYTKAGHATAGLTAGGADVFHVHLGHAVVGLIGSGTSASVYVESGYARIGGTAAGFLLTSRLPVAPTDVLVLTPETEGSFVLVPEAPDSFVLTPIESDEFVLTTP